jgi:hypothetical protein
VRPDPGGERAPYDIWEVALIMVKCHYGYHNYD